MRRAVASAYDREWLRLPQSDGVEMGFLFSFLLHAGIVILSMIVLPSFKDSLPPLPAPVIVDIVPISDITNLPPLPSKFNTQKIEVQPIEPDLPKPDPVKPQPAEIKPQHDAMTPKLSEKPKADEKKPADAKKPDQSKSDPNDFDSVLETVEKFKPKPSDPAPAVQTPNPPETKSHAQDQPFIPSLPISISEMDAVRRQIEACWNLPAGAKNPEDLIVLVWVSLNPDGTLIQAKVVDDAGRAKFDPYYRAAAESALRALLNPRCTPLKLPPEKYEMWKTMTINFDPRQMLGL